MTLHRRVLRAHAHASRSQDAGATWAEARSLRAGKRPVLGVKPSTGIVAAHSRLSLTATFAPAAEAPLTGRITCAMRRMSRPLALTVKGEGYLLRDSMQVTASQHRRSCNAHATPICAQ